MTKTGILGGTFNPIHLAHIAMAQAAVEQAAMEEIWFMPTRKPPHKTGYSIASDEHRRKMIELAILHKPLFVFSDFELRREGTTYTSDTLELLGQEYPGRKFYFIMGGDSLFQLESWHMPEKIMESCDLLAISRGDITDQQMEEQAAYLRCTYQARIQLLQMEKIDISSSSVRSRASQGKEFSHMVPQEVADYIMRHALYGA